MVKKTRARNKKGHYIKDDPSTPDVNEAYVGEKKKKPKKTVKKPRKINTAPKVVEQKPQYGWVGVLIGLLLLGLMLFFS